MRKTVFKNQVFYWVIISTLSGFLTLNLYSLIISLKLIVLLPIAIQSALLILIFIKHEYAKSGIKIWAILVLIVAYSLQFVSKILKDLASTLEGSSNGFNNIDFLHYVTAGIGVIIGVFIVTYTNKFVEVETREEIQENT